MMRVLLVEDEAATARIMRLALAKQGYEVEHAGNGREAFERIQAAVPDVLITDIEMPEMDGQALCEAIEEHLPDRSFPIYVVTSVTDLVHRKWTRDIADLHFVEKPVSVKRLANAIQARMT